MTFGLENMQKDGKIEKSDPAFYRKDMTKNPIVKIEGLDETNDNAYILVNGELALEALGSNIIVVEDKFRTGYECKTCNGEGVTTDACPLCHGSGEERQRGTNGDESLVPCRICNRSGKAKCKDCNGRGGLLVVTEESERRPSSGVIASVGPEVVRLKRGDHILYTQFCGNAVEFKNKKVLRWMKEHEVISKMYGLGKIGHLVK